MRSRACLQVMTPSNNCLAKSRHTVSLPRCRPLHHTNLNREVMNLNGKAPMVKVARTSEAAHTENAAQMPNATQHRCKALVNTPLPKIEASSNGKILAAVKNEVHHTALPRRCPRGTKTTDSRITPRVRVMGLKPYGRDIRLDSRKPGGIAATPYSCIITNLFPWKYKIEPSPYPQASAVPNLVVTRVES